MTDHVLIVEDFPDLREVMVMYLEMEGFEVTQAENGAEALKLFDPHKHTLILSDINMPRMDGIAFFHKLVSLGHTKNFVFLTGHADESSEILAPLVAQFGIKVLEKPVSPSDLAAFLKSLHEVRASA
jgi:CheY-like chemotaxis protein